MRRPTRLYKVIFFSILMQIKCCRQKEKSHFVFDSAVSRLHIDYVSFDILTRDFNTFETG